LKTVKKGRSSATKTKGKREKGGEGGALPFQLRKRSRTSPICRRRGKPCQHSFRGKRGGEKKEGNGREYHSPYLFYEREPAPPQPNLREEDKETV